MQYRSADNIALVLPQGVIGIDPDDYFDSKKNKMKQGAATIAECQVLSGPLPPTWMVTSRPELIPDYSGYKVSWRLCVSGIYLYRIPEDTEMRGSCGPHVDIIQHHNRHCMVWPSVHPETATLYSWYEHAVPGQQRHLATTGPTLETIPWLPKQWLEDFTGTDKSSSNGNGNGNYHSVGLNMEQIGVWGNELRKGDPCAEVQTALDKFLEAMPANRHDSMRDGVKRLLALGAQGHIGVLDALGELKAAFDAEVEGRDSGEWVRALRGGVDKEASLCPSPAAVAACQCAAVAAFMAMRNTAGG
jgi:hypothetical protein